jgi:hypothetical protein
MEDTTPEIAEKIREMIRAKSPSERAMMGCSMYETSRYLVTRGILEQNPMISKAELRKELFLKFYGSDFTLEEKERILKHLEETA